MNITAADNADGTGATITVAGSSGGAVSLFKASLVDGVVSASFAAAGSRTGNGTVVVAGVGSFWIYGVEAATASPVIGYRATASASDSDWSDILDATVARIQSLSLTGIASSKVVKQKLPWNFKAMTEGVYVSPIRESVANGPTNQRDDIGYGVQVTTFLATNRSLTTGLDTDLNWRDRISAAFRHTIPVGLSGLVHDVNEEPGPVIDPGAFAKDFDAGTLVLRFFVRSARGV